MVNLPQPFTQRMKDLMQDEYEPFIQSYQSSRVHGLRVNTLKVDVEQFLSMAPFPLRPVPWTADGFYYPGDERPGKDPYYHAGLYYIQEPSAMLPGVVLQPRPGEKVLDLCAAPGGKTVQIAAALRGEGVLITNDIHPNRTKALVKNIELYGIRNAVVTNESPQKLAQHFPQYFDRILVDAPCSGEGMFRKEPDMCKSWSEDAVEQYCIRQREILQYVPTMVKPGGVVVYSTCTFSPQENEQMIDHFLRENREFELLEIMKDHGISGGRSDWVESKSSSVRDLEKTARIWPHHTEGEGHYVALLRKKEDAASTALTHRGGGARTTISGGMNRSMSRASDDEEFRRFIEENCARDPLQTIPGVHYAVEKDRIFLYPAELPDLTGLKVLRKGWFLGTLKKKRFQPSQAFIMGLKANDLQNTIQLSRDDPQVFRYLRGETLQVATSNKGWIGVAVDGFLLGWAKAAGNQLKNEYPPGWRMLT